MEAISFIGKRTGRTLYRFELSEEEYLTIHDGGAGACVRCGAEVCCGVEPDARKYTCEKCGEPGVYGLEQLLILGRIKFTEDREDEYLENCPACGQESGNYTEGSGIQSLCDTCATDAMKGVTP